MISRRAFISSLLASLIVLLAWINFANPAHALGGKQPPINEPAPEFTLPTNT
ncbi:MAG: peroxiredoxin, partial [Moorea sp. SIO2C4]|nr:peroxiredoxin [Moorena sp. SIO2C4]